MQELEAYDLLLTKFILIITKDRARIQELEHAIIKLELELGKLKDLDRTVIMPRPAGAYTIKR